MLENQALPSHWRSSLKDSFCLLCSSSSSIWAPGMKWRSSQRCLRRENASKLLTISSLTGRSVFVMRSCCKDSPALAAIGSWTAGLLSYFVLLSSCLYRPNGKINSIEGVAEVKDPSQPAILSVSLSKGERSGDVFGRVCFTIIMQYGASQPGLFYTICIQAYRTLPTGSSPRTTRPTLWYTLASTT